MNCEGIGFQNDLDILRENGADDKLQDLLEN